MRRAPCTRQPSRVTDPEGFCVFMTRERCGSQFGHARTLESGSWSSGLGSCLARNAFPAMLTGTAAGARPLGATRPNSAK
jgi:hypothetical protein